MWTFLLTSVDSSRTVAILHILLRSLSTDQKTDLCVIRLLAASPTYHLECVSI